MSSHTQQKVTLRKQLRQQRKAIPPAARDAAAKQIARHVLALPTWSSQKNIAIYLAADGEADPQPLARRALQQGKRVFLPVITPDKTLSFAQWQPGDTLVENEFGIGEPAGHVPRIAVTSIDLVCMPLVGWSRDGTRLGMGGGFYDRTLAGAPAVTRLGLAYDCQLSSNIPCEHWDIRMAWVGTESGLHRCCDNDPGT